MEEAASQLLRALRGRRSQVAFARRLGYRSNVAADWEAGRRAPSASETLRAAQRVGVDVDAALAAFHPAELRPFEPEDASFVADWLCALAGSTSRGDLARRSQLSRHQVSRWLSGRAQPRLPDLLRLVDAATGRAPDLVAALAPIEQVPALYDRWRRARATGRLVFDQPWSAALYTLLETRAWAEAKSPDARWIARRLGLGVPEVEQALAAMAEAGVIVEAEGAWRVAGTLAVDLPREGDLARFKAHWLELARARTLAESEGVLTSVNVIAVSRADMDEVRALQRRFFRELGSLVAASEPSETVGVVLVHSLDLLA
ncbi:MAG: DUF4423 domain-containing protein [Alphaproteobacteria bacterium]|nr:DUF4423 domain-containing protein [Alphaproteobacteria bacterium]MCB9795124.1 DUF4423 domain-containing protein [Alphaproteobacteria bacterium]